jgi:hypothetical protein
MEKKKPYSNYTKSAFNKSEKQIDKEESTKYTVEYITSLAEVEEKKAWAKYYSLRRV